MEETVERADIGGRGAARTRYVLLALGAGLLLAVATGLYVIVVSGVSDPRVLAAYVPFVLPAAIVGVAPPSYVALDMLGRRQWMAAAMAWAIALLVAFVVFWSAAIAVTPRPLAVRMDPQSIVLARHYEHGQWLRYPALRDRMVDDLVNSGVLKGMTPTQVAVELGSPTRVVGPGCKQMCYELASRAGTQPVILAVDFGAQGRVVTASLEK